MGDLQGDGFMANSETGVLWVATSGMGGLQGMGVK
jgi:hypothetical protein